MYDALATLADIILALCAVLLPVLFIGLALAKCHKPKPPDRRVPDTLEYERMAALAEAGVMPVARLVEYAESEAA